MTPYFIKYRDNRGEWRFTFHASNHEAIAVASEGYATERSVDRAIEITNGANGFPVKLG